MKEDQKTYDLWSRKTRQYFTFFDWMETFPDLSSVLVNLISNFFLSLLQLSHADRIHPERVLNIKS